MMSQIYVLGYTINIHNVIVSCFSSREQEFQSGVCTAVCVFINVAGSVTFETMYICRLCDSVCAQVKFTTVTL